MMLWTLLVCLRGALSAGRLVVLLLSCRFNILRDGNGFGGDTVVVAATVVVVAAAAAAAAAVISVVGSDAFRTD